MEIYNYQFSFKLLYEDVSKLEKIIKDSRLYGAHYDINRPLYGAKTHVTVNMTIQSLHKIGDTKKKELFAFAASMGAESIKCIVSETISLVKNEPVPQV